MNFKLNPEKRCSSFLVPRVVVDEHLKLAGALQLRAILYCSSRADGQFTPEELAEALSCNVQDAGDALMFWQQLGVLDVEGIAAPQAAPAPQKAERAVFSAPELARPDRKEVARRGLESHDIAMILQEAQIKFGRTLKQSESSLLVWLYDDMGMSPALILMVLEYAVRANRCNVAFIERLARDWVENGVQNITDAEQRIVTLNESQRAWNKMRRAFGLEQRAPSENELKFARTAVLEWHYSTELFKHAYDLCVDSIGKYRLSYIKTILTKWHKNGFKTLDEVLKAENEKAAAKAQESTGYAAYDLSAAEQLINGD